MIHPITAFRSRFYIWWLIWLLTGLGQSLLLFYISDIGVLASFTDGLSSAVIFSLLAIAIWFPVKQLNISEGNSYSISANLILIGAITILIWIFGVKYLTMAIVEDREQYAAFWNLSFFYRLSAGIFIYALIILIYYLLISIENINKKSVREANLEKTLRETELMMLRSQINPHFLFNSLNSISSLTVTNPEKAREMVIKLSEFMRYALSRKEEKVVPLVTELENMRLYMEIEKIRFGDKLVLEESVDDKSLLFKVPNMIMQPLYENAVKHGVYESLENVVISISSVTDSRGVTIRIINNHDPENIPARGTGTGLQNVRRRLDLYYKKEAYLATRKENDKFIAEIFFPAEKQF